MQAGEDTLRNLYLNKGLTQTEIADQFDVSQVTVSRYLKKYGIKKKHLDENWLYEKFAIELLTMSEIADICDVTQEAIHYAVKRNEKINSTKHANSGIRNPSYKHGRSQERGFRRTKKWQRFSRNKIKEAGYVCEYCGNENTESFYTHHVEPVGMGGKRWDNKFLVLCHECHYGNYKKWHPPQLEDHI